MDALSMAKIFAMVATAIFAAFAILKDFKDKKSGQVTKWGKLAIGGICLSLLTSLFTYYRDTQKTSNDFQRQRKEAEEAKQRYQETKSALEAADRLLSQTFSRAERQLALQNESLQETERLKREFQISFRTILKQQEAMQHAQRDALAAGNSMLSWQLRSPYPLEPLRAYLKIEYPLDQPLLEHYKAKLTSAISERKKMPVKDLANINHPDIELEDVEFPDKMDFFTASFVLDGEMALFYVTHRNGHLALAFGCDPRVENYDKDYTVNFKTRLITLKAYCGDRLRFVYRSPLVISSLDLEGGSIQRDAHASWMWREKGEWVSVYLYLQFPNSLGTITFKPRDPDEAWGNPESFITPESLGLEKIWGDLFKNLPPPQRLSDTQDGSQ